MVRIPSIFDEAERRTGAAELRGGRKRGFKFTLAMAGYNLIRLPKLIEAPGLNS